MQARLRDWLDRPRQGILFDVEYNDYWHPDLERAPVHARRCAECRLRRCQGRPAHDPGLRAPDDCRRSRTRPGNPVFSIHQTDIICYGFDLADYLRREFNLAGREAWPEEIRPIRFWSACAQ